jgi:hypothetical protein
MKMPRSHQHHGRRISMGGRDVVAFGLDRHYLQDIYFYAMTSSWTMFFSLQPWCI